MKKLILTITFSIISIATMPSAADGLCTIYRGELQNDVIAHYESDGNLFEGEMTYQALAHIVSPTDRNIVIGAFGYGWKVLANTIDSGDTAYLGEGLRTTVAYLRDQSGDVYADISTDSKPKKMTIIANDNARNCTSDQLVLGVAALRILHKLP